MKIEFYTLLCIAFYLHIRTAIYCRTPKEFVNLHPGCFGSNWESGSFAMEKYEVLMLDHENNAYYSALLYPETKETNRNTLFKTNRDYLNTKETSLEGDFLKQFTDSNNDYILRYIDCFMTFPHYFNLVLENFEVKLNNIQHFTNPDLTDTLSKQNPEVRMKAYNMMTNGLNAVHQSKKSFKNFNLDCVATLDKNYSKLKLMNLNNSYIKNNNEEKISFIFKDIDALNLRFNDYLENPKSNLLDYQIDSWKADIWALTVTIFCIENPKSCKKLISNVLLIINYSQTGKEDFKEMKEKSIFADLISNLSDTSKKVSPLLAEEIIDNLPENLKLKPLSFDETKDSPIEKAIKLFIVSLNNDAYIKSFSYKFSWKKDYLKIFKANIKNTKEQIFKFDNDFESGIKAKQKEIPTDILKTVINAIQYNDWIKNLNLSQEARKEKIANLWKKLTTSGGYRENLKFSTEDLVNDFATFVNP